VSSSVPADEGSGELPESADVVGHVLEDVEGEHVVEALALEGQLQDVLVLDAAHEVSGATVPPEVLASPRAWKAGADPLEGGVTRSVR